MSFLLSRFCLTFLLFFLLCIIHGMYLCTAVLGKGSKSSVTVVVVVVVVVVYQSSVSKHSEPAESL